MPIFSDGNPAGMEEGKVHFGNTNGNKNLNIGIGGNGNEPLW